MREHAAIALAAVLWAGATTSAWADDVVAVDAARSHARFSVTHVYVQHVTGIVPIIAGSVTFAPGTNVPAKVSATLDARHVDTGNGDRDEDLQGPDWFDTRKFPTWTFASTAVRAPANGTFSVDGLLTVHGIAQPVTLLVTPTAGGGRTTYHATAKMDRHAFAMKVTPIDGLLGGDVDVSLDVVLTK